MRQYRDQFSPKPRPRGFSPNDRPRDNRPRRPAPPPRPQRPKGPAILAPKEPASGKKRRRMLKAAAWRLARIVRASPASLMTMEIGQIEDLIETSCPVPVRHGGSEVGEALRLAAKIERLRQSR